jgi:hypothetical protein
MIAVVLAGACSTVLAQQAPLVQVARAMPDVTVAAAAPQQAAPVARETAARSSAASDRRDDIKTLEAVLTMAVKAGADKLALQMRASEPGSLFVIDTGRTRGFDLQGYGVFFDVDVPMMKQSVLWSTRQLTQQDTRVQLENYIATQPPGPARDFAMRELRRMQTQGMRQAPSPLQGLATPVANPGFVSAQMADEAAVAPAALPAGVSESADPNELYTQAVKSSLIDAMLKYSVGLKLSADEWLTVAARDAQGPLTPGAVDDASTIVIRIKGGDLAAFHAGKLTREDVLKKVEVKEF